MGMMPLIYDRARQSIPLGGSVWISKHMPDEIRHNGMVLIRTGKFYGGPISPSLDLSAHAAAANVWTVDYAPVSAMGTVYQAIYANNKYFFSCNKQVAVYSSDLVKLYVKNVNSDGAAWKFISYANSVLVAGGQTSANDNIAFSTNDGLTWTNSGVASGLSIIGLAHDGTRFVALSAGGVPVTSTNGTNWTVQTTIASGGAQFGSMVWGNGVFVACPYSGTTGVCYTSTDGVTWTQRSIGVAQFFGKVVFLNNQFVAINTSSPYHLCTSSDGITWTAKTNCPLSPNSIIYEGGLYYVVGLWGAMANSSDLTTWSGNTYPYQSHFGTSLIAVYLVNGYRFLCNNGEFLKVVKPGILITEQLSGDTAKYVRVM
jgi:hypothetical protein